MEKREDDIMNNVCFFSHPKTGQHWILFFVANYHRILNGINEPISWENVMEFGKSKKVFTVLASDKKYKEDLPRLIRIEYPYSYSLEVKNYINSFDKRVYLYRNPFDTMISMYYYFIANPIYIKQINEAKTFEDNEYFEDFCKSHLDGYIAHIEVSIDKADLVLYYDQLKKDPTDLKKLLQYFYFGDIDERAFNKALEWSSFEYVNEMEKELKKGQENVVFHARDGRSGQYKELMSLDLINYIQEKWDKLKERVEYELV